MDLGIKDRLAVVTGASRGIGRGIAEQLATEGARVVLVARSVEKLEAVKRQMRESERHCIVAVDLMTDTKCQELAKAVAKFGDLDIYCARSRIELFHDWRRGHGRTTFA